MEISKIQLEKIQSIIDNNQNTPVAIHIGRGGRFNNQGHRRLLGEIPISQLTNDLFLNPSNFLHLMHMGEDRPNLQRLINEAIEGDKPAIQRLRKWGISIREMEYFDSQNYPVGLTLKEAETGFGVIEIDGDYNTTTVNPLSSFEPAEIAAFVYDSTGYMGYVLEQIREVIED